MFSPEEIVETFEMLSLRHLNLRALTLGINLLDCIDPNFEKMVDKIHRKITKTAKNFVQHCRTLESKYGVPIVNKRVAVTPAALLLEAAVKDIGEEKAVKLGVRLAKLLDASAEELQVDYIGGYAALVQKGFTKGDRILARSIPEALQSTKRVCACVNIADTEAGINVDAAKIMGRIIKQTAERTAEGHGIGCTKLVTFANAPEDNPFMPAAFHGPGEAEATLNVGISGPSVIKAVVEKNGTLDFRDLADVLKRTAFKITRAGELIGHEAAEMLGVRFGIVDLSLAPTPEKDESIADIIEAMGIEYCGAPGSTAALALLTDAVKKGGGMATTSVGGLSGAFIPVSEDSGMMEAVKAGALTIEKLEAMTAVCSAGLDMIAIPGDTPSESIAGLILDTLAIGVFTRKPMGVRVIPVPGMKAGDHVDFGGLLGSAVVMPINRFSNKKFIERGGQIPSPIISLGNR